MVYTFIFTTVEERWGRREERRERGVTLQQSVNLKQAARAPESVWLCCVQPISLRSKYSTCVGIRTAITGSCCSFRQFSCSAEKTREEMTRREKQRGPSVRITLQQNKLIPCDSADVYLCEKSGNQTAAALVKAPSTIRPPVVRASARAARSLGDICSREGGGTCSHAAPELSDTPVRLGDGTDLPACAHTHFVSASGNFQRCGGSLTH